MAKSINVSGRMSVGRFEDEFKKTFGVRCNVKLSKWRNADNKATLASINLNIKDLKNKFRPIMQPLWRWSAKTGNWSDE